MTNYTVLTFNIGNYEIIRPIKVKSPRAKYIMVTDAPVNGDTGGWSIVVDNTLSGSNTNRCYQVRYHPFKYTQDDIIVRIDGSMSIEGDLDPIVDAFVSGGYDSCFMIHPTRRTIKDEYKAWATMRGYHWWNANSVLTNIKEYGGYDPDGPRGLVQIGFQILRNDLINEEINLMTYAWLKFLAIGDDIERVDQCVISFVLQRYFAGLNIMWVDQRLVHSKFLLLHKHHSEKLVKFVSKEEMIDPYFFDKPIHKIYNPEDF